MSQRDQNRLAVLEAVFAGPGVIRSALQRQTGLSRATIFRVVDELTSEGLLAEEPTLGNRSRGRPTLALRIAPSTGHVVGVDVGVLSTRMMLADLNGTVLARMRLATPTGLRPRDVAEWLHSQVALLQAEARDHGTLLHLTVSLPGKIEDGRRFTRPATKFAPLAGDGLYSELASTFDVPVELRSDPDMALMGEMLIGHAAGLDDVVMFVMSSALSAAVAVDGRILGGRRRILGEFGAMPIDDQTTLSEILTVPGVLALAHQHGLRCETLDDVRQIAHTEDFAPVSAQLARGLEFALTAVSLSVDPQLIVITGGLQPLLREIAPEVEERLRVRLATPPRLAFSESGGYSQPRGCVEVSLAIARASLLGQSVRSSTRTDAS